MDTIEQAAAKVKQSQSDYKAARDAKDALVRKDGSHLAGYYAAATAQAVAAEAYGRACDAYKMAKNGTLRATGSA